MIYFWLIAVGLLYVVIAVMVGKICAINSRWEKTVDQLPIRKERIRPPFSSGSHSIPMRNVTVPAANGEEH